MPNVIIPNTTIDSGKLELNELEKIIDASNECGVGIEIKKDLMLESINRQNIKCREFYLVSDYNSNPDNIMTFSPMYRKDHNKGFVYLNISISNDEKIQEKFNNKLIEYKIYERK